MSLNQVKIEKCLNYIRQNQYIVRNVQRMDPHFSSSDWTFFLSKLYIMIKCCCRYKEAEYIRGILEHWTYTN